MEHAGSERQPASAQHGADPREDRVQWARRAIALIDLTDLADDTNAERVTALCERAADHGTAAVCVWPDFVASAAEQLRGTEVQVATVVNFPTGAERAFAVGVLTDRARRDGADEIDVVLPYRAFLAGDTAMAVAVLQTVREAAGDGLVKVILETGELGDPVRIASAARLAIAYGADFIKTSTGKSAISATPAAVSTMLEVIATAPRRVGIKPSGGISTLEDAIGYLRQADAVLGVDQVDRSRFRFGASGLLNALLAVSGQDTPEPPSDY